MRRGQARKKIDVSKAEDANIIEENKNSSLLTDPSTIETEFEFEKPPSTESIPLHVPLAGETSEEGQSMKNLGFDVQNLGDYSDINKEPISSAIAGDSGGKTPPPPKDGKKISIDDAFSGGDSIIDDVPPPNPNQKDLFDEIVEDGGGGGGGMSLPPDFVAWSAEKQAEWIVQTEKLVANGFMQNRARISTIDVRQRIIKNNLPNDVSKEIIHHVNEYNQDVSSNLQVSKDAEKALKMSWVAVLKQHSNISEKITPEMALIINHAVIFGQLWFQGNEIKKYGKDLLSDIDATLKNYKTTTEPKKPNGNTN